MRRRVIEKEEVVLPPPSYRTTLMHSTASQLDRFFPNELPTGSNNLLNT